VTAMTLIVAVAAGLSAREAAPERAVRYQSTTTVDLVIVAHEDDWQLFMGDALAKRASSGSRLVIVYLTAGDVGRDSAYWRTRERAAMASAAELVPTVTRPEAALCDTATVNGHRITRCALPNSIAWFLRLPDGRRNGSGYRTHGFQSLRKLHDRRLSGIDAIDGSTTYRGWNDLVATVRAVAESESAAIVSIHANDPSVLINPHDHYDHRMAGRLAADLERMKQWNAYYYLGYAVAAREDNLPVTAVQAKTRPFQAYDKIMIAGDRKWSALGEHRTFYSECLRRTYWRRSSVPRRSKGTATNTFANRRYALTLRMSQLAEESSRDSAGASTLAFPEQRSNNPEK
jgi:LmbE family N-acetylglucosaminyl deacetylase